MNRIKNIRKALGYTQAKFASMLNVSRTTVTMWETQGTEPDYETVFKISHDFDIPIDFIVGANVFRNWNDVIKYYNAISYALRAEIPPDLEMQAFSDEKYLVAWLDCLLYEPIDEIYLARWFDFAIKDIKIEPMPVKEDPLWATVDFTFTPAFKYVISTHLSQKDKDHNEKKPPVSEDDERQALANASDETKLALELLNRLTPENRAKAMDHLDYLLDRQEGSEDKK